MERTWSTILGKTKKGRNVGINAALFSAFFLGWAPIFGKQAILLGLNPLAVVALRTLFATILLFIGMLIFQRRFLYIYPAGLIGCLLAGWINGVGSLFYYSALGNIDAGVGQLLYSIYPLFVAVWMFFDKQPPSRLTVLRLLIALPAIYLIVQTNGQTSSLVGVVEMLIAAALFALHLPINQRVLYDIPAPTVTLYTLLAMSSVVVPTFLFSGSLTSFPANFEFVWPLVGLTLVTFLSRITLSMGVKHLGVMQTALLGLGELFITVSLARFWLGETMSSTQMVGALLLGVSLLLIGLEKPISARVRKGGWFSWLTPPSTDISIHVGE